MDDKVDTSKANATNRVANGPKWTSVLVGIVSAVLGSTGTVAIYLGTPIGQQIARPDPYTGTQGKIVEQRIARLESHIDPRNHPDSVNQFDRRITILEVQYSQVIATLTRIENKLDKLQ